MTWGSWRGRRLRKVFEYLNITLGIGVAVATAIIIGAELAGAGLGIYIENRQLLAIIAVLLGLMATHQVVEWNQSSVERFHHHKKVEEGIQLLDKRVSRMKWVEHQHEDKETFIVGVKACEKAERVLIANFKERPKGFYDSVSDLYERIDNKIKSDDTLVNRIVKAHDPMQLDLLIDTIEECCRKGLTNGRYLLRILNQSDANLPLPNLTIATGPNERVAMIGIPERSDGRIDDLLIFKDEHIVNSLEAYYQWLWGKSIKLIEENGRVNWNVLSKTANELSIQYKNEDELVESIHRKIERLKCTWK